MTKTPFWDTAWTNDNEGTKGDWLVAEPTDPDNPGGFVSSDELGTAILIALFTEASPDPSTAQAMGLTAEDVSAYHGDMFGDDEPFQSFLHHVKRQPLNENTLALAKHYAAEALQPLVRGKMVSYFRIDAEMDIGRNMILFHIVAVLPASERSFFAELTTLQ